MAKLNITVEYDDLSTSTAFDNQKAVLSIADVVSISNVSLSASQLISTDQPNDLKLGSDNKLFVAPESTQSTNFIAQYLLSRGNL